MKIAVLLSGGVDSSVALQLLHNEGHDLTAFYLKIWLEDETSFLGTCPWEEDLSYVQAVCERLKVPLRVVPLQKEYYEKVVSYTLAEIKAGRTPNPDVFCNAYIKFGLFFDHIDNSFEKVATGHYAQTRPAHGATELIASPDPVKDQTYFLAYLNQDQLARALFPIGHLYKEQVRELAAYYDLPTKTRKDSQGICFLGKLRFQDFIRHYLGDQPGNLVEFETGKILGTHKGFWYHTIGQRQGSGLAGGPWYVVSKDPATNTVYISRLYYESDKKRNQFIICNCNWIAYEPKVGHYQVKMRHGKHRHDCLLVPGKGDTATIILADNDQGIAQGQFAVLYDQDTCLGAGIIDETVS
ncbi:MAG TPA: tRNA 2-thiouridine(34) synthase MnmA [Candidatus Dependentiae bacterium]|nr:tRNA 2-thiouridine(34) synthase MnmA [Candidatus Dependentiae bacterium]